MKHLHNRRVFAAFVLICVLVCALSACGGSDMPFNGEVAFHRITLTIPGDFIRDSTESSDDLWVFEKGNYDRYILLSRQDMAGDAAAAMDSYAAYLTEQDVQVQRGKFLEMESVTSAWTREGLLCQEVVFVFDGSTYAVSLRGGTEADFRALLESIAVLSEGS